MRCGPPAQRLARSTRGLLRRLPGCQLERGAHLRRAAGVHLGGAGHSLGRPVDRQHRGGQLGVEAAAEEGGGAAGADERDDAQAQGAFRNGLLAAAAPRSAGCGGRVFESVSAAQWANTMLPSIHLDPRPPRVATDVFLQDLPVDLRKHIIYQLLDPSFALTFEQLQQSVEAACLRLASIQGGRPCNDSLLWRDLWARLFGGGWQPFPLGAHDWKTAFRVAYTAFRTAHWPVPLYRERVIQALRLPAAPNAVYSLDHSLHVCASRGLLTICKMVITRGGNVNSQRWAGNGYAKPLSLSVCHNHLETAAFLVGQNADVNWVQPNVNTTILSEYAVFPTVPRTLDMVRLLLDNGAVQTMNAQDAAGRTALFQAVSFCNLVVARELVRRGADVNIQDNNGVRALGIAMLRLQQGGVVPEDDGEDDAEGNTDAKALRSMVALIRLAGGQQ